MTHRNTSSRTAQRMARTTRAMIIAACGMAAPVALADVLISDFETGTGGVQTWNNPASQVADPTAASAYVLKLDATSQWWNRWIWANWSNSAITSANANNHYQVEFDIYFPSTLWTNGTADVRMEWEGGNGVQGTAGQTITVVPDTMQHVVVDYSSLGPITVFNPGAGWFDLNLFVYPGNYTGPDPVYPQSVYIDNLELIGVAPPPPNSGTWDDTLSGNWTVSGNWQGGTVAYGIGNSATFPTPAAPRTVTADIGVGLSALNLNGSGANGYTIDGTKTITLDYAGTITVNGGTHSITTPVTIQDPTTINVTGGGSLTINNLDHSGYGGFTKSGDGTLSVNRLYNTSLTLDGGTLNLLPGNDQAYGWWYAATLSNGAILNLNDAQVRCNGLYTGSGGGTINIGAGGVLTTGEYNGSAYYGAIAGAGDLVVGWQSSLGGDPPATPSTSTLGGTVTHTGSTLVTNGSILLLETSMAMTSSVTVNGSSTVRMVAGGGNNRVLKTTTLSLESGSKIDLTDNKLITADAIGSHNGTNYTGVTGLVELGRNGGVWDGTGITTSMTDATSGSGYTMLGVATGSEARGIGATDTDTWGGQTVLGSDTLVMYTYGGDANLSGNVDVDDYGQIDFNASTGGVLTGWFNGDFDYNGFQDVDDYGVIDFVINIQGPAFPVSGGASIAAVPEPGMLSMMTLLAAGALRRRRRI